MNNRWLAVVALTTAVALVGLGGFILSRSFGDPAGYVMLAGGGILVYAGVNGWIAKGDAR